MQRYSATAHTRRKQVSSVFSLEKSGGGLILIGICFLAAKPQRWVFSGSFFRIGFSPRANGMSIYLISGFEGEAELLSKLGKHKMGRCCLTFKRLVDLDTDVLKKLLQKSAKVKICSEVKD